MAARRVDVLVFDESALEKVRKSGDGRGEKVDVDEVVVGDVPAESGLEGVVVGGATALEGDGFGGAVGGVGGKEVAGGEDAVESGRGEDESGVAGGAGFAGGDGGAAGEGDAAPEVEVGAGERSEGGVGGEVGGVGIGVGVAQKEDVEGFS